MNISAAVRHLQNLCQKLPIENHRLMNGRHVDILRLDSIDTVIQGNKAAKLLGHLFAINSMSCNPVTLDNGQTTVGTGQRHEIIGSQPAHLLSFGGRYSNHLHALAKLGNLFDIPVIGLVQGYPQQPLSPTLKDCREWRMQIIFQNKKDYAQRNDTTYRSQLGQQYNAWVIAEGGGVDQNFADMGLNYWLPVIERYQRVWLASGSGTTLFGLMRLLAKHSIETQLIAVNCVADQGNLKQKVALLNQKNGTKHRVIDNGHGGGFGRFLDDYDFRQQYYQQRGLAIEPIYMDKLITSFIDDDCYATDQSDLLIHGGGLQGNRRG